MLTTLLDLLGLGLLVVFAYALEPVAAIATGGVACLVVSYRLTRARR